MNNQTYVTLYQYDALGNLLCVEQHGNVTGTGCNASPASDTSSPWRVRRFTYDSLSRLLTAHNPESGTITYSYDADGNLLRRPRPRPISLQDRRSRRPLATAMTCCTASPAKPGRRNRVRWRRLESLTPTTPAQCQRPSHRRPIRPEPPATVMTFLGGRE